MNQTHSHPSIRGAEAVGADAHPHAGFPTQTPLAEVAEATNEGVAEVLTEVEAGVVQDAKMPMPRSKISSSMYPSVDHLYQHHHIPSDTGQKYHHHICAWAIPPQKSLGPSIPPCTLFIIWSMVTAHHGSITPWCGTMLPHPNPLSITQMHLSHSTILHHTHSLEGR